MGRLKNIGSRLSTVQPRLNSLPEQSVDERRLMFSPWRQWYKTARWRALRLAILARDLFTCQWPGCGFSTADTSQLVADHRTPHRGDEKLFWDEGNLRTLCKACHDGPKQRAEQRGRIG